jgi:hypothetical protein
MASLRNLALSILRINGAINIAQAIRHHTWEPLRSPNYRTTADQLADEDFADAVGPT